MGYGPAKSFNDELSSAEVFVLTKTVPNAAPEQRLFEHEKKAIIFIAA